MEIEIKCSLGEIIDKMTILEIKAKLIKDKKKLININKELNYIQQKLNKENYKTKIQNLIEELTTVNNKLWNIEDEIRIKEKRKEFDKRFIDLARDVYKTNDIRSKIKKEINILLGSDLVEEKSYENL